MPETVAEPPPASAAAPGEINLSSLPKSGFNTIDQSLIDKLYGMTGETPPAAPSTPAAKEAVAKSAAPPAKAAEPAKVAEPAAAPKEAAPAKEPEIKLPKQLREAYEKAQAKVTELETSFGATTKEKAEALTRLAKAEEALTVAQKRITEEFEPLRKVHEETAKRLQDREEALRMRDFTATTQWHDQYVKPIVDVQQEALQFVGELVVTRPDGSTAPAGQEHLNYIVGAPNAMEAAKRAEELFGPQPAFTGSLVNYRTKLRALVAKQQGALQTAKVDSENWAKGEQLRQAQNREQMQHAIAEREKGYLAELQLPPEDKELAEALAEGRKLTDVLLNGEQGMTPERWADVVARGKVAVQERGVLRMRNARLAKELKLAQDRLALYEGSEPGVRAEASGGVAAAEAKEAGQGDDWKGQLLAEAMKRAKQR